MCGRFFGTQGRQKQKILNCGKEIEGILYVLMNLIICVGHRDNWR